MRGLTGGLFGGEMLLRVWGGLSDSELEGGLVFHAL